ncbi:hypothetical protein BDC45DRAFT_206447 [Circinella umbellata]|nr:hypothetical protein BDC45DRAFT_206447 [Circinella umbellata]
MDFKLPEIILPHANENAIEDNNDVGFNSEKSATVEPLPVIPLGKAVHTLLHVKQEAFQKAIAKLDDRDSPIVRALYSIDDYLNSLCFSDVYDPLKDHFLKPKSSQAKSALRIARYLLIYSRHRLNFATFLKTHELQSDDKRRHLAAALLLEDGIDNSVLVPFIPNLVYLAQHYGEKPTLIASIACDTVLAYSKTALQPRESIENCKEKMVRVIEEDDNNWNEINETWICIKKILSIMKKWYPFDTIALCAWNELEIFITAAQDAISDRDIYQKITVGWDMLATILTSKSVVSKKHLSIKKQLACLKEVML